MEKEQQELNNFDNDYCYYNGDIDYLILQTDKEKRKRDNDNNINNNVNDNNENYQ
jgi:hypothetical protein